MSTAAIERAGVWATPGAVLELPITATRSEWLARRGTGIGGSDIAALVGLSQYETRMGVYADKIGHPDSRDNDAMEWGRRLEDAVVDYFEDTTGILTRRIGLLRSKAHPIAIASIDRLTDCTGHCGHPDGLLETKTTNWRQEDLWDDEQIPDAAELQAQWYLGVTGRSHAHVVCLVDGRRPIHRTINANPDLFSIATRVAEGFWADHVEARTPPDPTAVPVVLDEVKRIYPDVVTDRAVVSPADVDPILSELEAVKAEQKDAEERRSFLESRLRLLIGDAAELVAAGDVVATCKQVTTQRLDSKALRSAHPDIAAEFTQPSNYRRLYIPKR
jgi:putative phage-type endonuclease